MPLVFGVFFFALFLSISEILFLFDSGGVFTLFLLSTTESLC